ncbi:arylesterase [Parapontixanthobacter aurantiacus]|uniref:arylesterase n=1 Tax=Parapontixanthobacter aurantiacus TaxID=1463599 RepID=UPI001F24F6BF|nr:arylesterase [Parapontixanthobacter aurantiacus]
MSSLISKGFARLAPALLLGLAVSGCGSEPAEEASQPAVESAAEEGDPIAVSGPERHILAFGNSLFAGYNVAEGKSYPAVLEAALRAQGINAEVVNAGISGNTTAAGRERLAFTLDSQETKPDLVILELGGNDLLRSLSPEETRANLEAMLSELQGRDIPVLLMGMRAPPNLGRDYVAEFDAIYPDLSEAYGADLVPFFLEPIYTRPELIQDDRVHPTAEGIEVLVEDTVDDVIKALPEA